MIGMGKTCEPKAFSFQCMTEFTTKKKKSKKNQKKKKDSQWEFAVWLRELRQGLCDYPEGWDGEGDGKEVRREGTWMHL